LRGLILARSKTRKLKHAPLQQLLKGLQYLSLACKLPASFHP
jgi:hypothetical protein